MHIDEIVARLEKPAPNLLENHLTRNRATGMAGQEFQQAELGLEQRDRLAANPDLALDQIDLDLPGAQETILGIFAVAAQQNLDPHGQLADGKGLGEIIVTARAQARDALIDIAQSGQHQHRRLQTARAQTGDQPQTVEARQHAIQGDGVEAFGFQPGQRHAAIVHARHVMPLPRQGRGDNLRSFSIVLDDQDAGHAALLKFWCASGAVVPHGAPCRRWPSRLTRIGG
jgi:hypothetical protein